MPIGFCNCNLRILFRMWTQIEGDWKTIQIIVYNKWCYHIILKVYWRWNFYSSNEYTLKQKYNDRNIFCAFLEITSNAARNQCLHHAILDILRYGKGNITIIMFCETIFYLFHNFSWKRIIKTPVYIITYREVMPQEKYRSKVTR